ncbi:basic proline-rich protein-like [Penaeus monodon]|uniref:basic proline-rich protein-like n=1 Tax=Penaeus monodon TaxID=6687 RepID=UPI0018A72D1A|nr:basic proline-rich protein-like [Penaeus monodon]
MMHGRPAPGMMGPHGRGHGSPPPHHLRPVSPQSHLGRPPHIPDHHGRFGHDLPPMDLNERRRQMSPGRQGHRPRSRSKSPYSGRPYPYPPGERSGPLSPRGRVPPMAQNRRGPRTPPLPSSRKMSPRPGPREAVKSPRGAQTGWSQDNKGPVQGRRPSPSQSYPHERGPYHRGGTGQSSVRRNATGNSPPPGARDQPRGQDDEHKPQYHGRNHSPTYQNDKQSENVRERIGAESDDKKRRLDSPRRSENRQKSPYRNRSPGRSHPLRGSSQSGRGKGRGTKGGRHASPVSDRNRRQVGRKRDNLPR